MAKGDGAQLPTRPVPYPRFDGTQPCLEIDPEAFFPETSEERAALVPLTKQLCADCPFIDECREYAVSYNVPGVWGGTTYWDRKKIRAALRIAAIPVASPVEWVRQMLDEFDDGVTNSEVIAARIGCSAKTVQRYRLDKQGVAA